MGGFFGKPANWLFIGLGLILLAMTAFAVFQPVKVVPRMAVGPDYALVDQNGGPVTPAALAGSVVLFGFGYTHDPTGGLDQTLADMRAFEEQAGAAGLGADLRLALILFDDRRDTLEQRRLFASENGLGSGWLLLGGDADSLKRTIGQGFGVYYEQVSMAGLLASQPDLAAPAPAPDDYGFLQARRTILVDERNIVRAEYRSPLNLEIALRDLRLIIRERNSTGAARAVNEAAHLFMCYPK